MKKNAFLFLVLLCMTESAAAQARHTLYGNMGYTFNQSAESDADIKNTKGFAFTLGGRYRLFSIKKVDVEIGLAAKTILAAGKLDSISYSSSTLRMAVPVRFSVPLSEKWGASGSFIFQNNVDFRQFDLRLRDKYSWRLDFLGEANYQLNDKWYLTAGLSVSLRNLPDPFLINDPKTAILVGVARRVVFRKKSK